MSTEKSTKLNLSMSNKDKEIINFTAVFNILSEEETQKSYKVNFSVDEINKIKDFKLANLSKNSNINGFRPGKAPSSFIWKQNKEALTHEIVNDMVNDAAEGLVVEKKLDLITSPKVEMKNADIEKGIEFEISFVTLPQIETVDFKKISLKKPTFEITDKDIETRVKLLSEKNKKFDKTKATHKAALGDRLVIDFEGKIDGTIFEGGSAKGHTIELGTKSFIDNFEDQLVGHKSGADVLVKVNFPADYQAKEFAGKAAEFAVKINEILSSTAITDSKELAEFLGLKSVEDMNEKIKTALTQECSTKRDQQMKLELLDQLDNNCDFSLPQMMLDEEFKNLWKQAEEILKNDKDNKKTESDLKEEYLKLAKRRVKLGILLAELAKINNIQVTQEDITEAVRAQAMSNPTYAQNIIDYYLKNKEATEQLKGPIIENKTIQFLFGEVTTVEKPITTNKLLETTGE
jgi:trigger factor